MLPKKYFSGSYNSYLVSESTGSGEDKDTTRYINSFVRVNTPTYSPPAVLSSRQRLLVYDSDICRLMCSTKRGTKMRADTQPNI